MVLSMILFVAACSNKDASRRLDDKRVLMQNSTDEGGVQRMQVAQLSHLISLQKKEYKIEITRQPNDSLPPVKSEVGDLFIDNRVDLRITRGREVIIEKEFTKNSFSSVVTASFLKKAILEGMVYSDTVAQGFVFAVSVSYPQTDLYIPITVTIDTAGKVSVAKAADDVF